MRARTNDSVFLAQRPRPRRVSGSLPEKEHTTDLDFGSGRNTSSFVYERTQSLFPTDFPKDLSSAGQREEGRGHVDEQKHRWRRSACIVDGGKEKEVGEMREALKVGLACLNASTVQISLYE